MRDKQRAAAYMREYRRRNPLKMRALDKKYYENHKEQIRAYVRSVPHKVRGYNLKRKHGISVEEYLSLLAEQGGGCAICGTKAAGSGRAMHVDHSHATGERRGLRCHHCNTGLGLFRDDSELLNKAINYLARRMR